MLVVRPFHFLTFIPLNFRVCPLLVQFLEEGGGTSSNEKSGTKSSTKHSRETLLNELTALADDAEGKKYVSEMKHFEMDLQFCCDESQAACEDRQHEQESEQQHWVAEQQPQTREFDLKFDELNLQHSSLEVQMKQFDMQMQHNQAQMQLQILGVQAKVATNVRKQGKVIVFIVLFT